jgi:hypothetical protein
MDAIRNFEAEDESWVSCDDDRNAFVDCGGREDNFESISTGFSDLYQWGEVKR